MITLENSYLLSCWFHCYNAFYIKLDSAVCKSRNVESGSGMKGMMGMRGIRVGMRGIRVGMMGIRVGMRGIGESRKKCGEEIEMEKTKWTFYKIEFSFLTGILKKNRPKMLIFVLWYWKHKALLSRSRVKVWLQRSKAAVLFEWNADVRAICIDPVSIMPESIF